MDGKYRTGTPYQVHRVSWEIHNGPIPDGLMVCHHCDVRHCVRPDHLFIGTQRDNIADMIAKGRKAHVVGGALPHAKLTAIMVVEARQWYSERGVYRGAEKRQGSGDNRLIETLAAKYGVERKTLSDAIHGKTWAHLPGAVPVSRKRVTCPSCGTRTCHHLNTAK